MSKIMEVIFYPYFKLPHLFIYLLMSYCAVQEKPFRFKENTLKNNKIDNDFEGIICKSHNCRSEFLMFTFSRLHD